MNRFPSLQILIPISGLLLVFEGTAQAQPIPAFTCTATAAVPPFVRGEGVSELMGDLVLRCTGGTPTPAGVAIPSVSLQVFLNTQLTSRLLSGSWTEVLLLLDEPGVNPANPVRAPCQSPTGVCVNLGNGAGGATAANPNYYVGTGTGANVNVFQGRLDPNRLDSVIFDSIPIDPPGEAAERHIRITNLRANASALASGSIPVLISGLIQPIAQTGEFSIPIINPQPFIGVIQPGFSPGVNPSAPVFSACTPQNAGLANGSTTTGTSQFSLRFTELAPATFKRRTIAPFSDQNTSPPPQNQNNFLRSLDSETGEFDFLLPNLGARGNLGLAGLADHGTRLVSRFSNVPPGVKIFVPAVITAGTPPNHAVARLVSTDSTGAGPFSPIPANASGIAQIPVTGPWSAMAVFEILNGSAQLFDQVDLPIYVAYSGIPELGPVTTVKLALGPVSTTLVASPGSVPIPRFLDSSVAFNAFSFSPDGCAVAPDVTAQMQIRLSGFYLSGTSVLQNVIVTNNGPNIIGGPFWLVLDSLGSNTTLLNRSGLTSAALPAGSPYIGVGLSSVSFYPGQSRSVQLRFQRPLSGSISYTSRILAGPYPR